MGLTESSLKTMTNPIQSCVSEVLGSFDCTLKSKCCENYKCLNFYYHCRTTEGNVIDNSDDEVTINNSENQSPISLDTPMQSPPSALQVSDLSPDLLIDTP